ncbi:MAG: MFS transporter [Deltaproteobacteria bacterium]|nr:MFS transporter [Deltaproteobacteria bacterium]
MDSKKAKKLLVILGAIAFLAQGDNYAAAPLLINIAKDLHLTIPSAALSVSAYMIPFGLFTLLFGPLADRYGKAKVLNLATFGTAIFSMLSATAFNLSSLCILRAINGAFAAAVLPVAVSLVGDSFDDKHRQNALGAVIGIMFLGGAVAPAIGGALAFWGSWRLLYLVYGVAEFIVALIMLRQLEKEPGVLKTLNFSLVYKEAFANKDLIKVVSVLFFMGFAIFGSFMYSGKFVQVRLGYNILAVGLLVSLFGIGTAIGGKKSGTIRHCIGNKVIILAGFFGGICWMTMAFWSSPILMAVSLIGFGFSDILIQTTLIETAQQLMPKQKGTVMSLASFNMFMGGGIGTFVNGRLLKVFGFDPIFFSAATIIFFVGVVSTILLNRFSMSTKKEAQLSMP